MRFRRSVSVGLLVLIVASSAAAACSSSSKPKATPEFSKALAVGYTADGGQTPVLPAKFSNCVYGLTTPADRVVIANVKTPDDSDHVADALAVRLTRNSNACDATLTEQLVQAEIFSGAPASITNDQRTCTTTKAIAAVSALDDSKVTGTGGPTLTDAAKKAASDCGVSIGG